MSEVYKNFISKEEINSLPLFEHPGRIELIDDEAHAAGVISKLLDEKILGFDTETRPSFSKGESYQVALLQLATAECAYLFRLSRMAFPRDLHQIFSNKEILKVGVGINDDLVGLKKVLPFDPQGFIDLAVEVKKAGFTSFGLRALTAIFLGKRLSKAAKVTNWERKDLTEAQLKYAANDAFVGYLIYHKMILAKK